ncbi:MAG: alpha/beta hydrolase [Calditrichae bacterium]|nr:alpha/beta hydrolase [Calditrichia bacterium]
MSKPISQFAHPIKRSKDSISNATLSYLYIDQDYDEIVIFLHGIPSSAELWREALVQLSRDRFAVYAPDLAGYGYTRLASNGDYSLAGSADLVATWIKTKFGKPVWLVGHDLGGAISQIIVTRYPEIVSRLTLCNTPVDRSWPVLPVRLIRLAAKIGLYPFLACCKIIPNPYTRRKMRKAFFDSDVISREKINRIFWANKLNDKEGRRQFANHLKSLSNQQTHKILKKLSEIRCPVQLIWAKNDYYQPWMIVGRRLEKIIPSCNTVLIENTGHYLPIEKPAELVRAMLNWYDTL